MEGFVNILFDDLKRNPEKEAKVRAITQGFPTDMPLHRLGVQILNARYDVHMPESGIAHFYRYLREVTHPLGFDLAGMGANADLEFLNKVAKKARNLYQI